MDSHRIERATRSKTEGMPAQAEVLPAVAVHWQSR